MKLSLQYYIKHTENIDQEANQLFEDENNSFKGVLRHYEFILEEKDNDLYETICAMVNTKDNKIGPNILNTIHNISNRLCAEKFLFGCLPLICDYFVLKDNIKVLQNELEKYNIK